MKIEAKLLASAEDTRIKKIRAPNFFIFSTNSEKSLSDPEPVGRTKCLLCLFLLSTLVATIVATGVHQVEKASIGVPRIGSTNMKNVCRVRSNTLFFLQNGT